MTPDPTTIAQLQDLGFVCGIAHGDVAVEQAALDEARAASDPQTVIERVGQLTADTLQTLANVGKLPDDPAAKLDLSQKIGAAALDMLTEHVAERVDFHERALAIAQEMPDVWHIANDDMSLYVSCKADGLGWDDDQQAVLDSLAAAATTDTAP